MLLLLFLPVTGPPAPPSGAATTVLTIAGVERTMLNGWTIDETANGRNTLSCNILSDDGSYRPVTGETITVDLAGERKFGGLVVTPVEEGVLGEPGIPIITRVTADDYNQLAAKRFVNETIPAGTLKAALLRVVSYLAGYGTTLDPAQVDGPAIPELPCEDKRADELLNQLTTLSDGYLWDISYFNVLSAKLPSGDAAPFDVTDADANSFGDITVEPSRDEFANRVIVRAGTGVHEVDDTLAVGDGVTTTFALNFTVVQPFGYVTSAGIYETLGTSGAMWSYDPITNSITRFAPPAIGAVTVMKYMAQFPMRRVADAGASPSALVERVVALDDVFDGTVAQAMAEAYLLQFNVTKRTVTYSTYRAGVHPRQSQTISRARRNYSALSHIIDVHIQHLEGSVIRHDVTAVQGTLYSGSWRDTMREWGGGAASSGGGSVSVTTIMGGRPAFFLGGNESLFVESAVPTWVNADAVTLVLDTVARGSNIVTVRVSLRALAGSVSARLYNVTDNASAGESGVVSSSTWTDVDFIATLAAGSKRYRLQLLPTVANAMVAGTGTLE